MSLPSSTPLSVKGARHFQEIRTRAHPRCVVCSHTHPMGLGQEFVLQPDGSVESTFAGSEVFEGYSGLLHGGVTAALLDGAMTNCLFAHGVEGLTAELTVRYRDPVTACGTMTARACLAESWPPCLRRPRLLQDGSR